MLKEKVIKYNIVKTKYMFTKVFVLVLFVQ